MVQHHFINLPPFPRGFHLIDQHIRQQMPPLAGDGILHLFIRHTSAALCLNENFDPSVRADFASVFDRLVPENQPYYTHTAEGPDDMPAHIKAALIGPSLSIPFQNGKLLLGTWQGVYLCEFRNHGGSRRLVASIHS